MDSPRKTKILFVDDDEMMRIYFRDVLWMHGMESRFDLKVADTLEEAEKIVSDPASYPDIIFLDLVIPSQSADRQIVGPEASFAFLERVKKDKNLKKTKVVIYSSHAEESFQKRALKLGAVAYLRKDQSMPKDLIDFIGKLTSHQ